MDNAVTRFRRPRYSMLNRRRRSYKGNSSIIKKFIFQLIAALLILLAIVSLKNFNSPIANFLTEKIKTAIEQNIEVKTIYEGFDKTFNKTLTDLGIKNEAEEDSTAVPASTGVYSPVESGAENENSLDAEYTQQQTNDTETSSDSNIEAESKAVAEKYSLISPVAGTLGSPFGERMHPIKKTVEQHKGVDIEANKGASIKAVMDGEISEAATEATYGKYIKIKHQDGLTTVYAHCSALISKKGQKVKQGAVIAKVGDTGAAVGAHLHFEIWKDGKALNPEYFIKIPEK